MFFDSAVGPRDLLRQCNIPLVADLPVGANLQDHLIVPLVFAVADSETLDSYRRPSLQRMLAIGQYLSILHASNICPSLLSNIFFIFSKRTAANDRILRIVVDV